MTAINEIAATLMEHLCEHNWHGYSQGARWGDGEGYCNVTVGGKTYKLAQGDRDCSSAIIDCYKQAGLNVSATYTGNMKSAFLATGMFEWKPMSFTAQRGDIYLNEVNHTAMCLSVTPDLLGEFCISETGGIYGQTGDQTGREAYVHAYYSYPWDGILHFKGGNTNTKPAVSTTQHIASSTSSPKQPTYNVMVNYQWLDTMVGTKDSGGSGDDYGGVMSLGMQYIAIAGVGKYRVCTQLNGWLPWVDHRNLEDLENGAAGDGSAIIAIEIPNPKIRYAVHTRGAAPDDWNADMIGNRDTGGSSDKYAGEMAPIDCVRIQLA